VDYFERTKGAHHTPTGTMCLRRQFQEFRPPIQVFGAKRPYAGSFLRPP